MITLTEVALVRDWAGTKLQYGMPIDPFGPGKFEGRFESPAFLGPRTLHNHACHRMAMNLDWRPCGRFRITDCRKHGEHWEGAWEGVGEATITMQEGA